MFFYVALTGSLLPFYRRKHCNVGKVHDHLQRDEDKLAEGDKERERARERESANESSELANIIHTCADSNGSVYYWI